MAKIIVADDDEITLTKIRVMLEKEGHEVFTTPSGRKVTDLADQHAPDLLITDIFMDYQDGIQTISQMQERFPSIPIITMSSNEDEIDYLEMTLDLGAKKSLQKPINKKTLLEAVENVLHL